MENASNIKYMQYKKNVFLKKCQDNNIYCVTCII